MEDWNLHIAGDTIDSRYTVLSELGRGGMGVVYKVRDTTKNIEVALKFCLQNDETSLRRFNRESRILQKIDSPNVIEIYQLNTEHSPPYFTMPLALNSLSDEIQDSRETKEALKIFKEICLGVKAIHAAGMIHRDLKPDNILRMPDKTIVVTDFGLAKFKERDTTTLTQTSMGMGTQIYSAPEQFTLGGSKNAKFSADIFSLGQILYELVSCETPIMIDHSKIPPQVRHIYTKTTQPLPDNRYQTVEDLISSMGGHQHQTSLGDAIDKAGDTGLSTYAVPFHRPYQFMGLNIKDVILEIEQLQRADLTITPMKLATTIENTECILSLWVEGLYITFIDIELKQTSPCSQTKKFDSEAILGALSINPAELVIKRKQLHSHKYEDHGRKLEISVMCSFEGGPLEVGFSSKYYGT